MPTVSNAPAGDPPEPGGFSRALHKSIIWPGFLLGFQPSGMLEPLTAKYRAELLYEYCTTSEKRVSESVHNLFIIAEHYSSEDSSPLNDEDKINMLPPFFGELSAKEKAEYCYNLVTELLSAEATPVTVESLRATKRLDPSDPWSSYAGFFVRRVTGWVLLSLIVMLVMYFLFDKHWQLFAAADGGLTPEGIAIQWVGFGCIGALVHLLNNALTTTRLQTFKVSETRKIAPRLMLGGMFGYLVPWLISIAGAGTKHVAVGTVAAFFAGYSVRFSIGLLDRLMAAVLPETKPTT